MRDKFPNLQLVAIANSKHTWFKIDGIDITKTTKPTAHPRPEDLADAASAQVLESGAIFSQNVDILVLAALENAVSDKNVDDIKAQVIVEIANGPITQHAADALFKKGVPVLPDVIANAGGVVVSYLEWLQNVKGEKWSEAEVLEKMSAMLVTATDAMLARAEEKSCSLKQAAFELALIRLLS